MLRILFWQEQHPTVHGGAETWLTGTAAGLRKLGHEVAWLQTGQIERAVEAFKPDVVTLGTLHCFVGLENVGCLAEQRIPSIWMLHDYWPFCGPRMLLRDQNCSDQPCEAVEGRCQGSCGSRANPEYRALVNRFFVVTGCDGAAQIMRRNGINVRAAIEEGIDTDLFRPGVKGGAWPVYASASGRDVWKGFHVLLQAVGPVGVKVLTGLPREELASTLAGAATYAFPSVYEEIWGLTLTEAMACGCAVVASDVAGARAQVHSGMGILVPPRNPAALGAALDWLAAHPKEAGIMGEAARYHVEQEHSLIATARRWEAVYQRVLAGERREACAI